MSRRIEGGPAFRAFDVPGAPAPIGHYSHVVELDDGHVYLSGQKATVGDGEVLEGDVEAQTHLVLDHVSAILVGVGLDLGSVVRAQCFLADPGSYEAFNRAYAARMGEHRPARAVVAGARLRGGALVEIVVEAYRGTASRP